MNAFKFGQLLQKLAAAPDMLNNMRASGQLQAGQKFRGGQLVSGPGAKPLSADQQDEVAFANKMQAGFNRLNASAGGLGRAGVATSPTPQSQPKQFPQQAPRPQSMLSAQRRPAPAARPAAPTGSNPALKLNTTSTPVNGQALAKQVQQMQQQPQQQPAVPAPSAATPASSWANQTNDPSVSQPPSQPQGPTMFQRMSNAYNAFRGATPGAAAMPAAPTQAPAQPSHIITTDNGRQFDTINKRFLDGRPGGFAR
jgi:hypothetical protein